MSERDRLPAALALLAESEQAFESLLHSIVEVARAVFAARASTIFLLDERTKELVFAAVAGEGEGTLIGQRFPSGVGIAGWVLTTRQPLVVEDVADDPRFAREIAETIGYTPSGLMAVPLLYEQRALGVLEVLDRQTEFTLAEMELLGLLASQAAVALELSRMTREVQSALEQEVGELAPLAQLAAAVAHLPAARRAQVLGLVESAAQVLAEPLRRD